MSIRAMTTVQQVTWKKRVNRVLRRATGYELRRPPARRSRPAAPPRPASEPVLAFSQPTAAPAPKPATAAGPRMPPKERNATLPPPRLPAGEAKSAYFFDDYPRLAKSRRTQMNLRYDALIHQNRDVLAGARVLDLACSEGSYSFGALNVGAAHVLGIEAREDKVRNANEHFEALGVAADRYRFIAGDVFQTLATEKPQVDVVICLGYIYHTLRYPELLHYIRETGAEVVIIDGEVAVADEPIVRLIQENVEMIGNAARDEFSAEQTVLSGRPSVPALEKMLAVYGYSVEHQADWSAIFRDNPELSFPEYAQCRRVSVRARRSDEPDWQDGSSRH